MNVFVYEAVTGGSLAQQEPAPSLVHEADLMVRALLTDLGALEDVTLLTMRDARLPPIAGVETVMVRSNHDPVAIFDHCLGQVDAAWIIAPETDGELERLSRRVLAAGRRLLGSHPDTIAIAASKRATVEILATTGLAVVPTFTAADDLPLLPGRWVIKPDDGAGAEDTVTVADAAAAQAEIRAAAGRLVAQPWIDGEALSLLLLCHEGAALLASVNQQEIRFIDGRVSLAGINVNAIADTDGTFAGIAALVGAALPGLYGWCGVDLIRGAGAITILEVNPRLTTSYVGLRRALDFNPAELMLQLDRTGTLPGLPRRESGTSVRLDLGVSHAI